MGCISPRQSAARPRIVNYMRIWVRMRTCPPTAHLWTRSTILYERMNGNSELTGTENVIFYVSYGVLTEFLRMIVILTYFCNGNGWTARILETRRNTGCSGDITSLSFWLAVCIAGDLVETQLLENLENYVFNAIYDMNILYVSNFLFKLLSSDFIRAH